MPAKLLNERDNLLNQFLTVRDLLSDLLGRSVDLVNDIFVPERDPMVARTFADCGLP